MNRHKENKEKGDLSTTGTSDRKKSKQKHVVYNRDRAMPYVCLGVVKLTARKMSEEGFIYFFHLPFISFGIYSVSYMVCPFVRLLSVNKGEYFCC